jgi:hypothetical protein
VSCCCCCCCFAAVLFVGVGCRAMSYANGACFLYTHSSNWSAKISQTAATVMPGLILAAFAALPGQQTNGVYVCVWGGGDAAEPQTCKTELRPPLDESGMMTWLRPTVTAQHHSNQTQQKEPNMPLSSSSSNSIGIAEQHAPVHPFNSTPHRTVCTLLPPPPPTLGWRSMAFPPTWVCT